MAGAGPGPVPRDGPAPPPRRLRTAPALLLRLLPVLRLLPLLLAAALAPPVAARAHARLVASEPAAGTLLEAAPGAVRLRFSEPVAPLRLRWILPGGAEREAAATASGETLRIPFPDGAAPGTLLLAWRVMSADGHPVAGTLALALIRAGPAPAAAPEGGTARAAALARLLLALALALAAGGAAFRGLADRAGAAPPGSRRLALAAALATPPLAVLLLGTAGLDMLGAGPAALATPAPWAAALAAPAAATAGLAALAGLLAAFALGAARAAPVPALGALLAGALALAASGHAAAAEPAALARAAMAVHGAGLLFWLGSLPPLLAAARAGGPGLAPLLARFSAIALPLVLLLLASGAVLTVLLGGSPGAVAASPWGRLLGLKLLLVAALLALAALNRLRLAPAVADGRPGAAPRLARSIGAEILIGLAVLVLAAGFRLAPPPGRAGPPPGPAETHALELHGRRAMARVTLRRAADGATEAVIALTDHGGAPFLPREVALALALPERELGPLAAPAARAEDGRWHAGPLPLALPGRWSLRLDLLVSDFERESLAGEVLLGPAGGP